MKRIIFCLFVLFVSVQIMAVPAKRGQWKTIVLTDGSEVKVELVGDEFYNYWQAEDGRKFSFNSETNTYELADTLMLKSNAQKKRAKLQQNRSRRANKIKSNSSQNNFYIGTKKGLIILAQFSDLQFQESNNQELYNQIANELNFTSSLGFIGSVKDYFMAQSEGQFEFDFDVVGPVTLSNGYSYYGANDRYGNDLRPGEMVKEACQAIADTIDFSDYDWDGDGEVEQVFILYAGHGENDGSGSNYIWPHQWTVYDATGSMFSINDIIIDTYACSNELNYIGNVDGIGTICHEFSHCFGLPDVYATAGYGYGMDCWDLLDYGNYNGDSFIPAGYTAYEKMFCGWREPIVLSNDTIVEDMASMSDWGDTYIIYNDGNKNEYYLLENRQQTGWDAEVPGSGLLITHIDYDESAWFENTVNAVSSHQRYTPIQADQSVSLRNTAAGDVYPYNENDSLTNNSVPAASLYNANTDGTYYMNKPITNISQNEDGLISFTFANNNTATGISNVVVDADEVSDKRVFSIDGRYLGNDIDALKNGIYIVGKKIVVK